MIATSKLVSAAQRHASARRIIARVTAAAVNKSDIGCGTGRFLD